MKLLLTSAGVKNASILDALVGFLGKVDFSIFPHLDHPGLPENSMADAQRWAAAMPGPAYAIDDQTAITVTDDGTVDIVSEGHRRLFTP